MRPDFQRAAPATPAHLPTKRIRGISLIGRLAKGQHVSVAGLRACLRAIDEVGVTSDIQSSIDAATAAEGASFGLELVQGRAIGFSPKALDVERERARRGNRPPLDGTRPLERGGGMGDGGSAAWGARENAVLDALDMSRSGAAALAATEAAIAATKMRRRLPLTGRRFLDIAVDMRPAETWAKCLGVQPKPFRREVSRICEALAAFYADADARAPKRNEADAITADAYATGGTFRDACKMAARNLGRAGFGQDVIELALAGNYAPGTVAAMRRGNGVAPGRIVTDPRAPDAGTGRILVPSSLLSAAAPPPPPCQPHLSEDSWVKEMHARRVTEAWGARIKRPEAWERRLRKGPRDTDGRDLRDDPNRELPPAPADDDGRLPWVERDHGVYAVAALAAIAIWLGIDEQIALRRYAVMRQASSVGPVTQARAVYLLFGIAGGGWDADANRIAAALFMAERLDADGGPHGATLGDDVVAMIQAGNYTSVAIAPGAGWAEMRGSVVTRYHVAAGGRGREVPLVLSPFELRGTGLLTVAERLDPPSPRPDMPAMAALAAEAAMAERSAEENRAITKP